jgi:mutator protein MutT
VEATLVAIAIALRDQAVLIGRRPAGVPLAGLWEFPGGKVREGETPAAAAGRECLEETGLAVEVLERYRVVNHRYDHGDVELHFFLCRPLDGSSPREPFRWLPRAELAGLEFPAANSEVIASLA